MPQGMNDIKRRMKSVTSTKQITKAMELVATAKLKRSRGRLEKSRPYFETILRSINEVLENSENIRHPFLKKREVKNSLYIIITGDRGLAGGYNSNVCKLLQNSIESKESTKLITIGSRGREYFSRRGFDIAYQITGVSEKPDSGSARKVGEKAVQMYKDGEIDEIKLIYTHFKSTISYEPTVLQILPAKFEESEKVETEEDFPIIIRFEPSPEEVLDYLIPKYINSVIYGAMIESSASENGSRRVAMENATDNAEEMIESLQLMYNRARQASITQEISEIVSGAEALK